MLFVRFEFLDYFSSSQTIGVLVDLFRTGAVSISLRGRIKTIVKLPSYVSLRRLDFWTLNGPC